MTTFDDREKAFESKFKLDQEIQFKVTNRRNKLLGLWIAGQIGKSGADAEAYAREVVLSDFEKAGEEDVVQKVLKDLATAGKPGDAAAIRGKMASLLEEAKRQVMTEIQK